jgi:16S rRNA (cytosine967-C5)-methyltransferase
MKVTAALFAYLTAHGWKPSSPNKTGLRCRTLSSQQTGDFFKPQRWDSWWDACAASGGKSLLLHEDEPNIKLVVSDIRESVLANLDERFQLAG